MFWLLLFEMRWQVNYSGLLGSLGVERSLKMQLFVADRGQNDAWPLVGSKIESGAILLTAVSNSKRYI